MPVYFDRFHSPFLQRGVRRRDVAGGGEHQRDGELGGADDVGGRRVDDHDAGLGGGADVDVVEADARRGRPPCSRVRGGRAPRRRPWWRSGPGSRRRRRSPASSSARSAPLQRADLEVGAERLDGGGAELFGDEYDGAVGHGVSPHSGVLGRRVGNGASARRCAVPRTLPDPAGPRYQWRPPGVVATYPGQVASPSRQAGRVEALRCPPSDHTSTRELPMPAPTSVITASGLALRLARRHPRPRRPRPPRRRPAAPGWSASTAPASPRCCA